MITTSANDWALQGAYLISTIQQNSSSWRAASHPPGHEKWGWKSDSSNLTYLDEGFPQHCSCHPQIGLFWTDCEWKVISSKFSTRQHCHEQHAPNQGPNSNNHQIPRPDTTYSVQSFVEGSFTFGEVPKLIQEMCHDVNQMSSSNHISTPQPSLPTQDMAPKMNLICGMVKHPWFQLPARAIARLHNTHWPSFVWIWLTDCWWIHIMVIVFFLSPCIVLLLAAIAPTLHFIFLSPVVLSPFGVCCATPAVVPGASCLGPTDFCCRSHCLRGNENKKLDWNLIQNRCKKMEEKETGTDLTSVNWSHCVHQSLTHHWIFQEQWH